MNNPSANPNIADLYAYIGAQSADYANAMREVRKDLALEPEPTTAVLPLVPSNDGQRAYAVVGHGYTLFTLEHKPEDESGNNCVMTVADNVATLQEAEAWIGEIEESKEPQEGGVENASTD